MQGTVQQILIAESEAGPIRSIDEVVAHAGLGLEGDRYHAGAGRLRKPDPARQATLIESEAVEAVRRDHGIDIVASDVRRNIVTAGVSLNDLVGKTFTVGEATLRGIKLCEPCGYMERLAAKPIKEPLIGRGGLNAEIVSSGTIRVGDAITVS